jgi:hypothetical protein
LNDLYKFIRLTLEENESIFQGVRGKVSGFAAGTSYPQIWLRDAQTILMVSKYFYDLEFLSSWIEEHLHYQNDDGSLYDWFDSRGRTSKNTTETDQESSAVLAAFQVFMLLGPGWLEQDIQGETIIIRLEKALGFVLNKRQDPMTGLVTGAHTADWGDVDMLDDDQEAVLTDDCTQWTTDIYDQSLFYAASLKLSRMFSSLGEKEKAGLWEATAESIRQDTNEWLWQEDKGFYRVHHHLKPLIHSFDENDMFAMGGNTQAVLSGIADRKRAARIIREALGRQKKFHVSTISGTLLPPYPKGTFRHPLMDDPYEYQNGAQWDWFGGRLITAMFENGFSQTAKDRLLEIAEKNRTNRGFFEWDTRDGVGMGSDYFGGSAGILGRTIIEGYFGINLTLESAVLSPRLGQDPGKIHVYVPALKKYIAYNYHFDSEQNKLIMDINSDHREKGMVRILSPWGKIRKDILSVFLNREKIDFNLEGLQNDTYIVFEAVLSDLNIEISL